jgi:hypothetical protein
MSGDSQAANVNPRLADAMSARTSRLAQDRGSQRSASSARAPHTPRESAVAPFAGSIRCAIAIREL